MAANPYDKHCNTVHDQHHQRHHESHSPVYKQVRLRQVTVCSVKTLLFIFFRTECPDNRKPCQYLPAYQIQPVYLVLYNLEFWHYHHEQYDYDHHDKAYRNADNPGHIHVCIKYLPDSSNCHDRRIQHHSKDHDGQKLDLLDIVGAPCDQRGCGKLIELPVGESDYLAEYIPSQAFSYAGAHP